MKKYHVTIGFVFILMIALIAWRDFLKKQGRDPSLIELPRVNAVSKIEQKRLKWIPVPPAAPSLVNKVEPKIGFSYRVEDVTGQGAVRASLVKVGVDYLVTERASVGVEAGRKLHDEQDAQAWNKSMKDEETANVKYKMSF